MKWDCSHHDIRQLQILKRCIHCIGEKCMRKGNYLTSCLECVNNLRMNSIDPLSLTWFVGEKKWHDSYDTWMIFQALANEQIKISINWVPVCSSLRQWLIIDERTHKNCMLGKKPSKLVFETRDMWRRMKYVLTLGSFGGLWETKRGFDIEHLKVFYSRNPIKNEKYFAPIHFVHERL